MAQLYVQGLLRHILFSFGKSSRNMERKFIEIESKNRIRERICSFLSMVFQFGVGRQAGNTLHPSSTLVITQKTG